MEITRPHTEVSKMRCQAMKINFWNNFYQDIWRRLPFSARKIYRESFSLVKLELLSTRARIHIKLPRSQIMQALPNIWSGQPRNRLKPWVCEARISRRLLHTSLLILRMWLCSSGQDHLHNYCYCESLQGFINLSDIYPLRTHLKMHNMNVPCRHKWTSLKKSR